MATNISTNVFQSNPNAPAVNLVNGDTLNLAATGLVVGRGTGTSPGVLAAGANVFNIAGDIFSFEYRGIDATGGGNVFNIASSATIFGLTSAIFVVGNGNVINNAGDIGSGGGNGLDLNGGSISLVNSGNIRAQGVAVGISGGNNGVSNSGYIHGNTAAVSMSGDNNTLVNTGTLQGGAAVAAFGLGGVNSFFNAGLVYGNSIGYAGSNAQDLIINNGLLQGFAVGAELGGGNDVYDGRNGNLFGVLRGGTGDDIIYGGTGGETLEGGNNNDQIYGGGGADVLRGDAGTDLIVGGAGGDVIRGGFEADLIVFNAGDNGDLIQSFNEGGVRDGFDLRGYFNATGYTGTTPRAAGIMAVLQNGADTDVYLHGAFAFRIQGVVAAAIDDTYFLFQ